jgi:adenylate cyclase
LASMNVLPPREAWPKVRAYAEKALALDPSLAEGVLLIADVTFAFDWDIKRAEEYYKRANELDPNLALGHYWYGYVLTCLGQSDEGITEMKRGLRLDPLVVDIMGNIARAYAVVGEYDSAFAYVRRMEEVDSSHPWIPNVKAWIYLWQGNYTEAIEQGKIAVSGKVPFSHEALASAYALSGQTEKARETLEELLKSIGDGYYSPALIGTIYCALGEREKVLEYFEKAIEERDFSMITPAYTPPWCDFVRSDPRYHEFMKKVGIEP